MTASNLRLVDSAEPLLSEFVWTEIQVSGLENFPMSRWREAILYYLFGVWGNTKRVMYRPKINFGGVTLRLDPGTRTYYAYGRSPAELPPACGDRELLSTNAQLDVEVALIRFVKNDAIQMLTIALENHGMLKLWKKGRRGEYGYFVSGVPASL